MHDDGHWGAALNEYMRDYNHWTILGLLCELLPQPDNRVTLADEHDQYGMPIANFSHSLCERRANIASRPRRSNRSGSMPVPRMNQDPPLRAPGRRLAEGLRPDDSVVDANHRVWEVPNLFIVDGSVFPTQGAANPALVIMALADRRAQLLRQKRVVA